MNLKPAPPLDQKTRILKDLAAACVNETELDVMLSRIPDTDQRAAVKLEVAEYLSFELKSDDGAEEELPLPDPLCEAWACDTTAIWRVRLGAVDHFYCGIHEPLAKLNIPDIDKRIERERLYPSSAEHVCSCGHALAEHSDPLPRLKHTDDAEQLVRVCLAADCACMEFVKQSFVPPTKGDSE